jgi:hypothetical protein
MKMENEIKAPSDGIVKEIPVKDGDRVVEGVGPRRHRVGEFTPVDGTASAAKRMPPRASFARAA